MTDLQAKFTNLQIQLTSQHTETLAAIAALSDLAGQLGTVSLQLQNIAEQDAAFYSAQLAALGLISVNLETLVLNNSTNTQRILALILATACPCDDIRPLPPILLPDPIPASDLEKCARIQFFIDLYFSWVVDLGTYLSSGGIGNTHINTLLMLLLQAEDIETGELSSGIPQYIRDSIMHQIANIDTTVMALSHDLISTSDQDIKLILISALYSVDNAVEGKEAFNNAIDTLEIPNDVKAILKTMFFSAWPNDIYGVLPVIDTSGYDGSICAGSGTTPCDELIYTNFEGIESDTGTWEDWTTYHLYVNLTSGAIITTVYLDGVPTEYPAIDPHMEFTAGSCRVVFAHPDGASGTYRLLGCPSIWGGGS